MAASILFGKCFYLTKVEQNDKIKKIHRQRNLNFMNKNDNIILIGMPGSGKSSIGVILAKKIGMNFTDVDLVIQEHEGELLQKTVDRLGADAFIELEADIVCSLNMKNNVIAPGGSAVLCPRGAEHLKKLGKIVYLKISLECLKTHLKSLSSRGIAMKPGQTLDDIYAYRTPIYEKYADITVDISNLSLSKSVYAVADALKSADN